MALFLRLTMLPFAIVAPLIGPVLDRFSHGRRWAIGATMALRAFLCWVLADAVRTASHRGAVPRGARVPGRVQGVRRHPRRRRPPACCPGELTLVKANSRISLAGVAGAVISAPLAVAASTFGPQWSLRYAFLVFIGATVLAILLPSRVDSVRRRGQAVAVRPGPAAAQASRAATGGGGRAPLQHGAAAAQSGFLTMFMAFLLRERAVPRLGGPRPSCCSAW